MGKTTPITILNQDLKKAYLIDGIEPTHKYCSDCYELKELNQYFKRASGLFLHATICKKCKYDRDEKYLSIPEKKQHRKEYQAKYFTDNKPELKKNNKQYRTQNKEKLQQKSKEYRQKNRHKKNERVNYLYKTDEDFRTKKLLRGRLSNVMSGKKNKKSDEYGIVWANCVTHLGPRPDKINRYCIDHIIPCAAFDFTNPEHPAICFHPSNLRWVLEEENLAKNDKIFHELINKHDLQWIIEKLQIDIDEWNKTR